MDTARDFACRKCTARLHSCKTGPVLRWTYHWPVQAKDNDSTALLLRGLQDGTLKMPKGWDAVPDSPIPLVGDYVDYEDYMREGGGNFEE